MWQTKRLHAAHRAKMWQTKRPHAAFLDFVVYD
jgi:hypothetical protein